jgi:hypothetical protein
LDTKSAVLVGVLLMPAPALASDWQHVLQACDDAAKQPRVKPAPGNGLSIGELNKQASSVISKWDKRYPWEDCVLKVAGLEPFGITFGSLAPGGGFGVGPRAQTDLNRGRVQSHLVGHGLISLDGSYKVEGRYDVMMPSFGQWNAATATFEDQIIISPFVRRTDLREMPFFGPGNFTNLRAAYREQRTEVGALGSAPLTRWFVLGGGVSYLSPSIRQPTGSIDAIGDRYSPADAPGLDAQPNFIDMEAFVRFHTPTFTSQTWNRHEVRITYDVFQDRGSGFNTFKRLQLFGSGSYELRRRSSNPFDRSRLQNFLCEQLVGNECRFGNLVLDALFTSAFATSGKTVPFYLQDALGGTDRDGFDTLRGLENLRLRAPNRVLLQAEFYKDVNSWFGVFAFYDRGAVALDRGDLWANNWQHDYGPGLFVRAGGRVVLRTFVAFGGGEGTRGGFRILAGL